MKIISTDLAVKTRQEELSTTNLSIKSPLFRGQTPISEVMARWLYKRVPMFFVSTNLDYVNTYIRSLALSLDTSNPLYHRLQYQQFYLVDITDVNTDNFPDFVDKFLSITRHHIAVIDDLSHIHSNADLTRMFYLTMRLERHFWFISSITWHEYVVNVERNTTINLQYLLPVLFSPRPDDLPFTRTNSIAPDTRFTF